MSYITVWWIQIKSMYEFEVNMLLKSAVVDNFLGIHFGLGVLFPFVGANEVDLRNITMIYH